MLRFTARLYDYVDRSITLT